MKFSEIFLNFWDFLGLFWEISVFLGFFRDYFETLKILWIWKTIVRDSLGIFGIFRMLRIFLGLFVPVFLEIIFFGIFPVRFEIFQNFSGFLMLFETFRDFGDLPVRRFSVFFQNSGFSGFLGFFRNISKFLGILEFIRYFWDLLRFLNETFWIFPGLFLVLEKLWAIRKTVSWWRCAPFRSNICFHMNRLELAYNNSGVRNSNLE